MARIVNLLNNENNPNINSGIVNVNSGNVYGSNIVATATGTTFPIQLLENFDWFQVQQTSGANDFITLPASIPVGTVITLYAVSACKIESSGGTINGTAATTDITLPASSTSIMRKVTTTAWVMMQQAAANGAITAPVA